VQVKNCCEVESIVEKIITEGKYFYICDKDEKPQLVKCIENNLVIQKNDLGFMKYCTEQIRQNNSNASDNSKLEKAVKELIFHLKMSNDFYKDRNDFLPPPKSISLLDSDIHFEKKTYNKDNRFLRLRRINANFNPDYIGKPLPELLEKLLWNGINNPKLSIEDNEARYNCLLDHFAYSFFPENPNRKIYFIVGVPHSGKTTICKIFRNIFGPYACSLDMQSVIRQNRQNPELRPDLVLLPDMLWVDISELDHKQKIRSRLIKNIAGNDPLPMRNLNSSEMKQEIFHGKMFIVSNFYPQFDNAYDQALKERIVLFDWYNSISDNESNYNLSEILSSDENRSHIASFFIGRAINLYNEGRFNLSIHSSFIFKPDSSLDDRSQELNNFFTNHIRYYDVSNPFQLQPCPLSMKDIYKAYINYHYNFLRKPMATIITKREFYKKFREHLEIYTNVFYKLFPNDTFYYGIEIDNCLINFNLMSPECGNFGKPKKGFAQSEVPQYPVLGNNWAGQPGNNEEYRNSQDDKEWIQ